MSSAAIVAQGLEKHFGHTVALHPLDLRVPAGSALAVLGPNGAGKSTLLRLLAGLTRPSAGRLEIGEDGTDADRRVRRGRVGLLAHATLLYPQLTARENLLLAGRLYAVADPAGRADALLARFELDAVAGRPASALSRGTAQRVSIARALVHDPAILLLDEPFVGLDVRSAERLAAELARLRQDAHTIVMVTHDLPRAAQLADRALLLVRGWSRLLSADQSRNGEALQHAYREATDEGGPA